MPSDLTGGDLFVARSAAEELPQTLEHVDPSVAATATAAKSAVPDGEILSFPGLSRKRPRKRGRTQRAEPKIRESPLATDGIARKATDGIGQPPRGPEVAGGTIDDDDRQLIIDYAHQLMQGQPEARDAARALVDAFRDLVDDALLQHAVSMAVINRMLEAGGVSFDTLTDIPDDDDAESLMLEALTIGEGRIGYPHKEGPEEALGVLRLARTRFPATGGLHGALYAYLLRAFPKDVDASKIDFIVNTMLSTGQPHVVRVIAHLVRLAVGLYEKGSTLQQALALPPREARMAVWPVLKQVGQPGVAGYETFKRRYAIDHPETAPSRLSALERSRLSIIPDVGSTNIAIAAASEVYRQPFDRVVEVLIDYYGLANQDILTGAYVGHTTGARQTDMFRRSVDACRDHVAKTGELCWLIGGDIINLSGLNKFYMEIREDADPHIRAIYKILTQTLGKYVADCASFRTGGDEFAFIAIGIDEATLKLALQEAQLQVDVYVRQTALDRLKPGKLDAQEGFGWHLGYTQVLPEYDLEQLKTRVELQIDASKSQRGHGS